MVVNPGCSGYLDDIEPRHAITQSALTESDMEKLLNGVYAKMEYYLYQLWWNDDTVSYTHLTLPTTSRV